MFERFFGPKKEEVKPVEISQGEKDFYSAQRIDNEGRVRKALSDAGQRISEDNVREKLQEEASTEDEDRWLLGSTEELMLAAPTFLPFPDSNSKEALFGAGTITLSINGHHVKVSRLGPALGYREFTYTGSMDGMEVSPERAQVWFQTLAPLVGK